MWEMSLAGLGHNFNCLATSSDALRKVLSTSLVAIGSARSKYKVALFSMASPIGALDATRMRYEIAP
jgi:hypothetical protein